MHKYDNLELARIIGVPVDPRKPYPKLIDMTCTVDTAVPDEYVYAYDVLEDTDKVYVITATGAVTQEAITPDTPALLSFADFSSPEYYIKLTELAKSKEPVFARKKKTINRAMNAYENYKLIGLIDAACISEGNTLQLSSGETSFNFQHVIDLIDSIIDYSDDYVLVAGTQIDKDVKLFDWTDNKYQSTVQAFKDLGIEVVRVKATVTIDGSSTAVLGANTAYLVGRQNEDLGRPVLWVRKALDTIDRLGGIISEPGEMPERLVFVSPNPIQVGSSRFLAVGITGFEEYAGVVTNPKALVKFTRQT